jgi:hypothetical protein
MRWCMLMALDMILVVGIAVVEIQKGPRHPKELSCGVLAWGRGPHGGPAFAGYQAQIAELVVR